MRQALRLVIVGGRRGAGCRDRAPEHDAPPKVPPPAPRPLPPPPPARAEPSARNHALTTAPADYQLTSDPCPIALPTSPDDPDVVLVDAAHIDAAPASRGDPARGHDVLIISEMRDADRLYGRLYLWDRAASAFVCAGEVNVQGADLEAQALRSRMVALIPSSQVAKQDPAEALPPRQGPRVLSVGMGMAHYCALLEDGTVHCVGDNDVGQCGTRNPPDRPPIQANPLAVPGIAHAIELAVGGHHACVRDQGGQVVCWGENFMGELGGGGKDARGPVRVRGLGHVTQLAAGDGFTCALERGGAVACWGNIEATQGIVKDDIAQQRSTRVVRIRGLGPAAELCAGSGFACARLAAGGVSCWGGNAGFPPAAVEAPGAVSLSCDHNSPLLCYGTADHRAACVDVWHGGRDVAPMVGVDQIAPGFDSTCALAADGTVQCWGNNDFGQVGDGTTTKRDAPTAVPALRAVKRIAVGNERGAAILADDGLAVWGYGPIGDGRDCSGPPCDGLVPTAIGFPK
jgi:hypothetical protein